MFILKDISILAEIQQVRTIVIQIMKRVLPFLLIIFLISCGKSKEEKAAELIKEKLFSILIDYSSYEPIELKLDSSFTDIYRDTSILNRAIKIDVYHEHLRKLLDQAKKTQKDFDFWVNIRSNEGRQRLANAKSELHDLWTEFRDITLINNKSHEELKNIIDSFVPQYEGWKANHRFRCKTKTGNYEIVDHTFYFDKDMTQITESHNGNEETYEQMVKIIDEVKNEKIDKEKDEKFIKGLDNFIKTLK
ncbi:hypothetical protein [Bacteroides sp. 51]|uniref:hypothetical protein n=1 Tax=Bacteroides sp. 51 TaxID=2302938 RepID=UPI0013D4FC43|nr:hypothetical protein [Bacteroides sp. 51]NDV84893.1 hypothetical protein [Bacteroides sp. 51]